MMECTLLFHRAKKAFAQTDINRTAEVRMKSDIKCNTATDGTKTRALMRIRLADEKKGNVIFAEEEGIFETPQTESDADRKIIYSKCFNTLFPFAAERIAVLGEMTGFKHIDIRKPELNFDDIV